MPYGFGIPTGLVKRQTLEMDRRVLEWHRASSVSKTLEAIPGLGPLISTALVASIPEPKTFRSGHDLSAWIGLVPKQNSTGGKERLGSITKAGNRYLRRAKNRLRKGAAASLHATIRAFRGGGVQGDLNGP